MKIYTRRGDQGMTDLFGGKRVSKAEVRVEAFGTVDELNTLIGAALAIGFPIGTHWNEHMRQVQDWLFRLGSDIANPQWPSPKANLTESHAEEMEKWIDRLEAALPPLRHFILPGGTPLGAQLHCCRAVCRRAERRVLQLSAQEPVNPAAIVLLNRLADFLFVLARWSNHEAGQHEIVWRGDADDSNGDSDS